MEPTLKIFGFIAISGLAGYFLGKLKAEKKQSSLEERIRMLTGQFEDFKKMVEHEKESYQTTIADLQKQKENINIADAQKAVALENMQEKLNENKEEVNKLQEKFTKEFENLAAKILEEKSEKFTKQNKENLKLILTPLQETIETFEKKIETTNKNSIEQHTALKQQIIGLKELNQQMSKETVNLTKALKGDSKVQGNWGELILERVLEKSGLEKGREYELEKSFSIEDGGNARLRPDVIINLPDNRKMIIDAKVSLTAYEQYVNTEDEQFRDIHLKDHVSSLNRHVDQLSAKKYEDLYQIESPDFVLLFMPIEPAFALALSADEQLYNKAFEKNIVIVTPTTLLATLRTIDSMWQNEKQQRNAMEIARQAGALYDKFEGLWQDLIKVGKRIDDAKTDYSSAMGKLVEGKGNLISSVERIKKLGAKAKKSLPENVLDRAEN